MEHTSVQTQTAKTATQNREPFFGPKKAPFFGSSVIQPKLTIGAVDDPYEREADDVADKVMRMDSNTIQTKPLSISSIQRKCAACEQEEKQR